MTDTKHGWVTPRADGARARCGGPGVCATCDTEAMHEKMLTGVFGAPASASVAPGDAQDDDSDIPELRSEAEIGFEDWLTRQMPKGTVISNPAWWAPRILRAAERLIRAEEQLAAAPAAGDALDAARYRWLRDHACNSLHLTRDGDHACNYLTAAQWIESCPEDFQDDAPEEIERMKATNTIWRLQVYPSTPIGFWVLHASTLDAAIDAALAAQVPQQGEA